MRGRTISRTWKHDPTLYAPPRYRRACSYAPFIPDPLAADAFDLSGEVAGRVAEAEQMVAEISRTAGPELRSLGRLLLRTESIASSRVEGMQADARQLGAGRGKAAGWPQYRPPSSRDSEQH